MTINRRSRLPRLALGGLGLLARLAGLWAALLMLGLDVPVGYLVPAAAGLGGLTLILGLRRSPASSCSASPEWGLVGLYAVAAHCRATFHLSGSVLNEVAPLCFLSITPAAVRSGARQRGTALLARPAAPIPAFATATRGARS